MHPVVFSSVFIMLTYSEFYLPNDKFYYNYFAGIVYAFGLVFPPDPDVGVTAGGLAAGTPLRPFFFLAASASCLFLSFSALRSLHFSQARLIRL